MEALPQIYNRFPFQIPLKNTFLYLVQNPKIAAQGATHVCHHPEEGKARAGCWEERARAASDGRRHSAGSRHPRRRVRPRAARARRQGRNEKPWGGGGAPPFRTCLGSGVRSAEHAARDHGVPPHFQRFGRRPDRRELGCGRRRRGPGRCRRWCARSR